VDIIATEGTPPSHAAEQATTAIPIVMTVTDDPVVTGLVANLARPGGNVTGASFFFPEIGVKRLELPKEGVPAVSRVLLIWNPANAVHEFVVKAIEAAATGLTWSSTSRRPRPSVSPSLRRSCSGRIR
jgi:putative ABC transport system substrate-binding protein